MGGDHGAGSFEFSADDRAVAAGNGFFLLQHSHGGDCPAFVYAGGDGTGNRSGLLRMSFHLLFVDR